MGWALYLRCRIYALHTTASLLVQMTLTDQSNRTGLGIEIEMKSCVGGPVGMAIQAGNAQTRFFDLSVFGLVELLLRKRGQEEPHPLHLDRRAAPHTAPVSRRIIRGMCLFIFLLLSGPFKSRVYSLIAEPNEK